MTAARDRALDALLAELTPPPMPAGLADRVIAAATALPQAAAPAAPRPARDRRGAWLRRPLLVGGAALGLAFSGAVAATYAGVDLPAKVQTVLAQVPFIGHKAASAPPPRPHRRPIPAPAPVEAAAPPAQVIDLAPLTPEQRQARRQRFVERLRAARAIVAERRAAGLPTPRADRIERMIDQRRAARANGTLQPVDPVRRAERRARLRAMIEARRAGEQGVAATPQAIAPDATNLRADPAEIRRRRFQRWRALRMERMRQWGQAPAEQIQSPGEGNAAEPR